MESLDELLREAEIAHGHLCAGQVLGVRMAMLGCRMLGIDDPRGKKSRMDRKRLVTFVEIDRCATDAIAVVTGCRLGKRALKFRDWGKMAASFVDLGRPGGGPLGIDAVEGGRAVRVAALESSKERAREMYPHIEGKNAQQMFAYREMADEELFSTEWVSIPLHAREMPGYKAGRIMCEICGEGINFDREVVREDGGVKRILCHGCAAPEARYYSVLEP
ncbi:MAG TPA: formylmethanofuran dehydrogenase subunit E family protein [Acidobacteriaceae bacterium]|nr:formylmethanofuran dehydrogenase subunit E family protein [Acidobacteriaceae bacterium]